MKNYKKIISIIMILAFVLSMSSTFAWAKTNGPNIVAEAAIIYVGDTGEILLDKNANKQMEPASMTKLMTCLIAVEKLNLNDTITASKRAENEMPTEIGLIEGEEMTVKDLVYAALLYSGNDAATTLAEGTAGSVEEFAKLMNERAAAIGCKNTNFVNATGHSAEGHLTTCKDMALIAEEALSNEFIRKVCGTAEYTIPATNTHEARKIETSNLFISGKTVEYGDKVITAEKYKGVFGGKTGSLLDGYTTMTTALDYDGIEIYSVLMGSTIEDRFNDMKKLMDYAKTSISKYVVFKKGSEQGHAKLTHGATNKVAAIAAQEGFVNLPEGASASLVSTKCVYSDNLEAPIEKGQIVGVTEIYMAGELYSKVELVAAENVETGWFLSPLGITNVQTVIIFVIIGIIIAFCLMILYLRIQNKKRIKAIRKRKIEEEARRQLEREEDLRRRNWHF